MDMNTYGTYTVPQTEYPSITSVEEDEAFKDLEKAIKNWKPTAP